MTANRLPRLARDNRDKERVTGVTTQHMLLTERQGIEEDRNRCKELTQPATVGATCVRESLTIELLDARRVVKGIGVGPSSKLAVEPGDRAAVPVFETDEDSSRPKNREHPIQMARILGKRHCVVENLFDEHTVERSRFSPYPVGGPGMELHRLLHAVLDGTPSRRGLAARRNLITLYLPTECCGENAGVGTIAVAYLDQATAWRKIAFGKLKCWPDDSPPATLPTSAEPSLKRQPTDGNRGSGDVQLRQSEEGLRYFSSTVTFSITTGLTGELFSPISFACTGTAPI
jgi:hypothetical protein